MSDNEEIETGDGSGGGLRQAVEAANKRAEKAEVALAQLSKQLNERQLADVLSAKNVNPRVARFITADGVDPADGAAVDKWLTDHADVFGPVTAGTPDEPDVSQAERQAFEAIQQSGNLSPAIRTKYDELIAKAAELAEKGDTAGIDKLYAESGL